MEKRLVKLGEAARLLGTSVDNLRQWEKSGELLPAHKTQGGTRYYDAAQLLGLSDSEARTVGYARVSSHDQKADLVRQQERLETYCAAQGWRSEIIQDLGSGMNDHKAGLLKLIEMILNKRIKRLVVTHQDRLLRFGSERVLALCEWQGIEIVIIHQGERPSFEEELAQDVLEIMTVFSARLYGSRSQKHRKLLQDLQASADPFGQEYGLYDPRPPDQAESQ
jgi:putative resolvase